MQKLYIFNSWNINLKWRKTHNALLKTDADMYRFLIVAILLSILPSCKKENQYVKYNNVLVDCKGRVDSAFVIFNEQANIALKDNRYDTIADLTAPLLDIVDMQIVIINSTQEPSGGSSGELKVALNNYINSVANIAKVYSSYRILSDKNTTIEQFDSINKIIKSTENKLDPLIKQLVSAQQKYAKITKIKLENN